jgi:hypothetical protein
MRLLASLLPPSILVNASVGVLLTCKESNPRYYRWMFSVNLGENIARSVQLGRHDVPCFIS